MPASLSSSSTRVGEGLPLHRDKPPLVAPLLKSQLQHTVGVVVVDLEVFDGAPYRVMVLAAGTHHKLSDAALLVRIAFWVLWFEALVVVVVTRENHVYSRGVEHSIDVGHLQAVCISSGTEERVVDVDQGASLRQVGCQVTLEPLQLSRAPTASTDLLADAVQGD